MSKYIIKKPRPTDRPRVKFCWHCGRKLWGDKFTLVYIYEDQHPRVCHIECGEGLAKGDPIIEALGE